ncbi:FKBP-type peptidyl-prolyl cis-trans isomerase [Mycoplasmopsis agassizii]|uniref:peptidylprolyl isomerase n=1 Tax=Mycoplasmopsis agassizii TaxID=33922 RepID=A0ABX4H5U6_9BACT|nr:FKBP-type peptidyl-prolyl cis-trans isomerase [Mycoplasmopsis agassizii]PAF55256.1 hypothetical protein CJF60_01035 [Mycoplasmopsis agassizii]SMC15674.1 FKBP-type peptidyl-prolyl cis-trans isomerase [Mycoplasmopsis agassizii]
MKKSKLLWMLSAPVLLIGTATAIACAQPNNPEQSVNAKAIVDKLPKEVKTNDSNKDLDKLKETLKNLSSNIETSFLNLLDESNKKSFENELKDGYQISKVTLASADTTNRSLLVYLIINKGDDSETATIKVVDLEQKSAQENGSDPSKGNPETKTDDLKTKAILTKSTISKEKLEHSNDIRITVSYKEDDWTSKQESEWTTELLNLINKKIAPEIDALLANENPEDFVSNVAFSYISSIKKEELKMGFLYGLKTNFTEDIFTKLDGLKFPEVKITDEQVTAEKTKNAANYILSNETDEEVKNGDTVIMDFLGKLDGVAFNGGAANNQQLIIGSKKFIPGFEEQIIGHKKGETFDIKVTFPENYQAENLKGKETVFTITLHKVITNKKAEYTDEIAKKHLTITTYTNNLDKYISDSIEALLEKNKLKVANSEVHRRVDREISEMRSVAIQNGVTLEQIIVGQGFTSVEQYRSIALEQLLDTYKKSIIISFLKEKNLIDFTLSEENKESLIKQLAILNNRSELEVRSKIKDQTLNAIYQDKKLAEYFAKKQNSEAEFKLYSDFLKTL